MTVAWNKVTWYSKLGAVLVLMATIALGFYFWNEYQEIQELKNYTLVVIHTEQPAAETVDSTLGETEDWQTYRNEEFGFELRYPDNVIISEASSGVRFDRSDQPCNEPPHCPLFMWVSPTTSDAFDKPHHYWTMATGNCSYSRSDGNRSIEITRARVGLTPDLCGEDTLFHQILSTFRFVESEQASTEWETTIENGFVIVKNIKTEEEIARVSKTNYKYEDVREQESLVKYAIANEKLRKLYVFVSDPELSGRNLVGSIIESDLDGTNHRRITGWNGIVISPQFSPDWQRISYGGIWVLGSAGTVYTTDLNVIDIINGDIHRAKPPKKSEDYNPDSYKEYSQNYREYLEVNATIHSHTWVNEDVVEFKFEFSNGLGPLSPEETWQYNVKTGEQIFISENRDNLETF